MRRTIGMLAAVLLTAVSTNTFAAGQKLTVVTSEGLQSITLYIARMQGYFEQEGLDLDFVNLSSGTAQTAALVSGSADLLPSSFVNIIRSRAAGAELIAFAMLLEQYPLNIVLSNEAIAKSGITPTMAIDDKVKRLKGLNIGISGPGSSTDQFARSLFMARGIDPETYISLQPIGDGPTTWAAFQKKIMDGFSNTAPWIELAQSAKLGQPVIDPFTGEVPELKDVPYLAMAVGKKTLAERPQIVLAASRALTRALRFAQSNPQDVRKVRQFFPALQEDAFNLAVDKYRGAMPKSLAITPQQMEKTLAWMNLGVKNPTVLKYEDMVTTGPALQADAAIPKQ